ncbi:MAG: LysR family transcriptional regulator [Pseudomonadota bacterium]|jgi:DNA-binding transcriptional LysR family regulator|nr:LysR family transcriptional regulator [Pseudomonadota bacterium]
MKTKLNDLIAFIAVAEEESFTRAAARLSVSQSALSHTIKGLEERLGLRLLTRTTRSVALTEIGRRLYSSIAPRMLEIENELDSLNALKEKPAGTIRISAAEHAARSVVWPKILGFMQRFPDIHIEMTIDYSLSDIVADKYDAGVRLGESVEKDMIAVSISPPLRMAVVATPEYFSAYGKPVDPRDLSEHRCINLRLPTYGRLLVWDFEKDGHDVNVRVEGQFTANTSSFIRDAVLAGVGIAYLPEDMVLDDIAAGKLERVLDAWCDVFPGYYLYFPNRSQYSPAFSLFVEAMRDNHYPP